MSERRERKTSVAADEDGISSSQRADDATRLIVFISYSQSDMAFADRLVAALNTRGFVCRIDRRNLEYGQKWQAMLADFIAESDVAVFVVSPRSIQSQWCRWELAEIATQSKRVVPVVWEPIPPESLPPEIGDWHLLPFGPEADFEAQIAALTAALMTDREWAKEHTRLAGLAATWDRGERRSDMLIAGRPLAGAEQWKSAPRKLNLRPSALVEAFVSESRAEETRRARVRTRIALGVAVAALVLAGVAVWQGLEAARNAEVAEQQKVLAQKNDKLAQEQRWLAQEKEKVAQQQTILAQDNERLARAQLRKAQIQESRRLLAIAEGIEPTRDYASVALLALEALPDKARLDQENATRPEVDNLQRLLDKALASNRELAILSGHSHPVKSAAFSADRKRIVTASGDSTARLWDAATGKAIVVLKGHEDEVNGAAFNPDGTRIVTTSDDKTARVWDAATGQEIAVLKGCEDEVKGTEFSPDGTRILILCSGMNARVLDAVTGEEIAVLETDWVTRAAFSPDGKRIITASGKDDDLRIWDAATGRVISTLAGEGETTSVAFSPDGKRIVAAYRDLLDKQNNIGNIWDLATAEVVSLRGHEDAVNSAAFSLDGTRVVTASDDNTARVWNAATGKEIARLQGHQDHVLRRRSARTEIASSPWPEVHSRKTTRRAFGTRRVATRSLRSKVIALTMPGRSAR